MARRLAAAGLALGLALLLLWLGSGREPAPAGPARVAGPGREAPAAPPRQARDAERALLVTELSRALPGARSAAELERLAGLLLEARDAGAGEPPEIAREIRLRIAEEFERLAGEPLGDVASRIATPFDHAPRRPGEPEPPR
jgi:hypothetical protein